MPTQVQPLILHRRKPSGVAPLDGRQATGIVLSGVIAVAITALGIWLFLDGGRLTASWRCKRPELLELAFRFAGTAVWALGQMIVLQGVVRVIYRPRRGDSRFGRAASLVFLMSALAAIVLGLTALTAD